MEDSGSQLHIKERAGQMAMALRVVGVEMYFQVSSRKFLNLQTTTSLLLFVKQEEFAG
jgi:hypothetical protein